MTGRSLHDALLRVICEAPLQAALVSDPAAAAAALGNDEARALARADGVKLRRLARFMARHFYPERLVRLFRHARAVLVRAGRDPIDLLDDPAFLDLLEAAIIGSSGTAERVAATIERRCRDEVIAAQADGKML